MKTVSSGDYSFEAKMDGKYVYCFSNEHWSANSKEVSFNVHGIVYVPESDTPSDPLEGEGKKSLGTEQGAALTAYSSTLIRGAVTSQGRAGVYRCPRAHPSKYCRKHEFESQVVVDIPAWCIDWRGHLSGLVAQAIL
jgi:hypothetical protein